MIAIATPIPTVQRIMARLRAGEDLKTVARDEEIPLRQLEQELRAMCPEYVVTHQQLDQPAQPRRKSTRGHIRNKQLEKAMHAERENFMRGVPEDQRWKLLGRQVTDRDTWTQLEAKIEHYRATGRFRSSDGEPSGEQPSE